MNVNLSVKFLASIPTENIEFSYESAYKKVIFFSDNRIELTLKLLVPRSSICSDLTTSELFLSVFITGELPSSVLITCKQFCLD